MLKLNVQTSWFMRTMMLTLIVFLAACSAEEPFESIQIDQQTSNLPDDLGDVTPSNGYILAQLVPTGTCFNPHNGAQGTAYSVRASSGLTTVGYDRIVQIGLVDDGTKYDANGNPIPPGNSSTPKVETIVETAIVTIPAGQTQSQAMVVLDNASKRYYKLKVEIFSVFNSWAPGAQDIQGDFEIRNTEPNVNNCYISSSTGPGIDPCGIAGDEDGDGICDYVGPDDN